MRPVNRNKGGSGGYQWKLSSDLSARKMAFLKGNKTVATRVFGTGSPTWKECLDAWLTVAKVGNQQEDEPMNFDDIEAIVGVIKDRFGKIYVEASNPLTENLGSFCSYCEMYLPSTVEVEHVAPKAQYPLFILAWENFNLACGPCNKRPAKGDQPSRSYVVDKWLDDDEPDDEIDYYNQIRKHYAWPDTDKISYTGLLPTLQFYNSASDEWLTLNDTWSIKLDMRHTRTDKGARKVYGTVYVDTTTLAEREVRVTIENGVDPYSQQMIDLCLLNSVGGTTPSDRRLIQRTETWFAILKKLSVLRWVQAPGFEDAWEAILDDAKRWGFYSVWARILQLTQMKDPSNVLLFQRFVTETNAATYYPNTDTANVK